MKKNYVPSAAFFIHFECFIQSSSLDAIHKAVMKFFTIFNTQNKSAKSQNVHTLHLKSILTSFLLISISLQLSAQVITTNTNWSAISPVPDGTANILVKNGSILTVDVSDAVA